MRTEQEGTLWHTEKHEMLLTPKYLDWLDHALLVVQSSPVIVYSQVN